MSRRDMVSVRKATLALTKSRQGWNIDLVWNTFHPYGIRCVVNFVSTNIWSLSGPRLGVYRAIVSLSTVMSTNEKFPSNFNKQSVGIGVCPVGT